MLPWYNFRTKSTFPGGLVFLELLVNIYYGYAIKSIGCHGSKIFNIGIRSSPVNIRSERLGTCRKYRRQDVTVNLEANSHFPAPESVYFSSTASAVSGVGQPSEFASPTVGLIPSDSPISPSIRCPPHPGILSAFPIPSPSPPIHPKNP